MHCVMIAACSQHNFFPSRQQQSILAVDTERACKSRAVQILTCSTSSRGRSPVISSRGGRCILSKTSSSRSTLIPALVWHTCHKTQSSSASSIWLLTVMSTCTETPHRLYIAALLQMLKDINLHHCCKSASLTQIEDVLPPGAGRAP